MAEALASAILEQLTSITIEKASESWRLVKDVEEDVKRLEKNFTAMKDELEDAEDRQYLDKRLKPWLERFKEASYDMEDVLEDWKTTSKKLEKADLGAETSRKVCPFVSCFSFGSKVVKRHDIATRIKAINDEIDQIVKDKDKFNLVKRESIKRPKWPETTSFVDVSKLVGRDMVKEDMIRKLLCGGGGEGEGEGSTVLTITIIGMGGLGKTSLAQLIYNDPIIQYHFDKRIWVCVSDPFDLGHIARAILAELDSTVSLQNTTPLQALFRRISENIEEKKLLLVLDDVWKDDGEEWDKLKATFQCHVGSRILVTTRKDTVAKHIGSSYDLHLDELSDEVCWLILSQKAFTGRDKISCEDLEDIGREIAKKCKGLPLAAVTLGGLLQHKLGREEWQDVLNSEIWTLNLAETHIFRPLLLSYYDLPSTVKQCLLYCAMFPKDYDIYKDLLIYHWMAQGYLNDDHLKTGADYFNCLATRSFFQDFNKSDDGDIIFCKMHDIVHDFVLFLTDECGFVTKKLNENSALNLSSRKDRHLKLVIGTQFSSLSSVHGIEKLRSLVAIFGGGSIEATCGALQKALRPSNYLRFLELVSFCGDIRNFPDIGNLIHLRHLSLIGCLGIKCLPESVCELPNLQSLKLQGCSGLQRLPVGIGKLMNLRYLFAMGCSSLAYYPKGIRYLTSLMRLSHIKVSADRDDADKFSIGDLENLNLLGGNLHLELTGHRIELYHAKRAKLYNKTHLKQMDIYISSPHLKKEEVLQALNPPSNLRVELFGVQVDRRKFSENQECLNKMLRECWI